MFWHFIREYLNKKRSINKDRKKIQALIKAGILKKAEPNSEFVTRYSVFDERGNTN